MRFISIAFPVFASILALAGCYTDVNVNKATKDTPGLRYSLPAVFLLVQPQSDGSASYDWVYLPDPNNEYAVSTSSFLAKYTLDVTVERGLLKKVTTKADDTAIAAKALDAAQSTLSAKMNLAAETAKEAATQRQGLEKSLAEAQLEEDQAIAELRILNSDPAATDAQKLAAKLKLAAATAKRRAAERALMSAANIPEKGTSGTLSSAWGPVLFRVIQSEDGVELRAVEPQREYDTISAKKANEPIAGISIKMKGDPKLLAGVSPLSFEIIVEPAIFGVTDQFTNLSRDGLPYKAQEGPNLSLSNDGKEITVKFPKGLEAGVYKITPAIIAKEGDEAKGTSSPLEFTVQ